MQIKTIKTHNVSFSIQAFWNEEGGMGDASYGRIVHELHEAIAMLELAQIYDSKMNWIIVCDVETKITKG